MAQPRTVLKNVKGMDTSDGAGVKLYRVLGQPKLDVLDPFLMLDEFKNDDPDAYIAGFPNHPHRGFETVSYLIEGSLEHKDSRGNTGLLNPGAVQWMTAGRGIIHSEMPMMTNGLLHGFQLWINLPAKDKMCDPRYQDIQPENIPVVKLDDGTSVKVIAGEFNGVEGAVNGIVTAPVFLDVQMAPDTTFTHTVPVGHTMFTYLFDGSATFGPETEGAAASPCRTIQVWSDGDSCAAKAGSEGGRFLLIAALPIKEPIARYGPFVMNTQREIQQAFLDYDAGRLGRD